VSLWEPDEADGWSFRVEGLSRLLRPTTRLVVANFPHNPTGSLPTRDAFVSMISCIREIGAYFLSDEMYRGLEFDADRTLPAACDEYDRALSLSGLSKAYGLAGLRLGWLASQDAAALKRIAEMKDYTTICSSAPSEVLGIIALRNREAIVEAQRERLASNLGRLDTFFRDFSDCLQWQRPSAGSIGFPRVLCAENTDAFCEEAVDEAGVLLAPSSIFAYGVHHIRIGYGRANLPEVLGQFEHWLRTRYR